MLEEGEIDHEKADTILERPDLVDPTTELRQGGIQHKETEYLLLGTVKAEEGAEDGIGLLVVDVGIGVYRRIGLVIFRDMTLWRCARRRTIALEPKLRA